MPNPWWKESVIYQIYPRSFCDSNGDGIGDLRGILTRLDYLKLLGVDVIWLSPVYQSPNVDNGYDISDYQQIMPEFGTLVDWEELLREIHRGGMRLVMDLVVNHTSDQHTWFQQARHSKKNPYRDYYIWRPPRDGKEPNNWAAHFGGSAWTLDPQSGEYYLHLFTPQQPDLNWENPRLRQEIYTMMRWWLDKGIDGFRMDVINMLSKVDGLPDAPVLDTRPYQYAGKHFINGPRLFEYLEEMKREVLSRYDVMTVGETPDVNTRDGIRFTHPQTGVMSMLFQFEHMHLDKRPDDTSSRRSVHPWRLSDLKRVMSRWQNDLYERGWNSQYLENHDQPRSVSRFGDDGEFRVVSAKMLAIFLFMLQGTPYIYQGQELGMTNVRFNSIEDYRDVESLNLYQELVGEGGMQAEQALNILHAKSRDNARTLMQWDSSTNAGFTTGQPWIKVNPNYTEINASQALSDPDSVYFTYQKLIRLRKEHPVIVHGRYELLMPEHSQVYAFTRTLGDEQWLVVLNFSREEAVFDFPDGNIYQKPELIIANYPKEANADLSGNFLRPFEARVYWQSSPD
ncbi:MAG: glucohydrolase [Chloroflexi bacterium RBG_16_54_18]|nr:MAG: glucohydrolase [Chloroflexi bacterium RBG_16_54_18]